MKKTLAIVLLSGGMDSTLCTALALESHEQIACLHVNYGQRTQERELRAFNDVCDYYSVSKRLVVDIGHLARIGGSSLTDQTIPVPTADLSSATVPSSYVPFRNANILAIATSWAEVICAKSIYIGAVQDDSTGYPDCRVEFFDAFQKVINTGTKQGSDITIQTPIIRMSKQEIVQRSVSLNAPLHLSWSCYQSETAACGLCDSCALRLRGFAQAGVIDPISYQIRPDYR